MTVLARCLFLVIFFFLLVLASTKKMFYLFRISKSRVFTLEGRYYFAKNKKVSEKYLFTENEEQQKYTSNIYNI